VDERHCVAENGRVGLSQHQSSYLIVRQPLKIKLSFSVPRPPASARTRSIRGKFINDFSRACMRVRARDGHRGSATERLAGCACFQSSRVLASASKSDKKIIDT
jgi:hypothetical protein